MLDRQTLASGGSQHFPSRAADPFPIWVRTPEELIDLILRAKTGALMIALFASHLNR
jgi:hypothetical protein